MSVLDDLIGLDLQALRQEHSYLTEVHDWALASLNLDYTTGDLVEIVSPKPSQSTNGWKCYAESLVIGKTGTAGDISFNRYANGWYVLVGIDRTWATSQWATEARRYWNGPAEETPPGFQPPSDPEGKVKHFAMRVEWVRKATS